MKVSLLFIGGGLLLTLGSGLIWIVGILFLAYGIVRLIALTNKGGD